MKLEEYSNLTQKEAFFETTNISTHKEFDDFYDEIKTKDLLYRGIHEAKYKIYTSAQREWITNEYSKQGISFIQFIQSIISNIRKRTILSQYYKSLKKLIINIYMKTICCTSVYCSILERLLHY